MVMHKFKDGVGFKLKYLKANRIKFTTYCKYMRLSRINLLI
jgi:hypothetical protein